MSKLAPGPAVFSIYMILKTPDISPTVISQIPNLCRRSFTVLITYFTWVISKWSQFSSLLITHMSFPRYSCQFKPFFNEQVHSHPNKCSVTIIMIILFNNTSNIIDINAQSRVLPVKTNTGIWFYYILI